MRCDAGADKHERLTAHTHLHLGQYVPLQHQLRLGSQVLVQRGLDALRAAHNVAAGAGGGGGEVPHHVALRRQAEGPPASPPRLQLLLLLRAARPAAACFPFRCRFVCCCCCWWRGGGGCRGVACSGGGVWPPPLPSPPPPLLLLVLVLMLWASCCGTGAALRAQGGVACWHWGARSRAHCAPLPPGSVGGVTGDEGVAMASSQAKGWGASSCPTRAPQPRCARFAHAPLTHPLAPHPQRAAGRQAGRAAQQGCARLPPPDLALPAMLRCLGGRLAPWGLHPGAAGAALQAAGLHTSGAQLVQLPEAHMMGRFKGAREGGCGGEGGGSSRAVSARGQACVSTGARNTSPASRPPAPPSPPPPSARSTTPLRRAR